MNRRLFLATSCSACFLGGAGVLTGAFSSCAGLPVVSAEMKANSVTIPLSLFSYEPLRIVRVKGLVYEIAVEKSDDAYRALLLQCTHAENPLTFTGNRFVCPLHGSAFDEDGRVLKGPAERPLKNLATSIQGDQLTILIDR